MKKRTKKIIKVLKLVAKNEFKKYAKKHTKLPEPYDVTCFHSSSGMPDYHDISLGQVYTMKSIRLLRLLAEQLPEVTIYATPESYYDKTEAELDYEDRFGDYPSSL